MTLCFDPKVLAEQREQNARIVANSSQFEDPRALDLKATRLARTFNRDGSLRYYLDRAAVDEDLTTDRGVVRVRRFKSAATKGIAIHFHGGGWAMGSVHEQDRLLREIEQRTALEVVSVEYPLAPEVQLPVIIDTCRAALSALMDQNRGRSAALIGESAGAHLMLASLLAVRDMGRSLEDIRALTLSYGIYDLGMTPSQLSWGTRFLGLSTPWLEYFYDLALPGLSREQRRSPSLAPLYADLTGLPPALFTVGTLDPLLDDSILLHQRWLGAGNVGRIDIYSEAGHGFNHVPTTMAAHANAATCQFLLDHLDEPRMKALRER